MLTNAITGPFREGNEVVAVLDENAGRAAYAVRTITATGAGTPLPYAVADFEHMLRETKPQYVIVTTPDALHDEYIVRALDAGCDVITEKPMTTTAERRSASSTPSSAAGATSASPSTTAILRRAARSRNS